MPIDVTYGTAGEHEGAKEQFTQRQHHLCGGTGEVEIPLGVPDSKGERPAAHFIGETSEHTGGEDTPTCATAGDNRGHGFSFCLVFDSVLSTRFYDRLHLLRALLSGWRDPGSRAALNCSTHRSPAKLS
jgi:hypothetical protein